MYQGYPLVLFNQKKNFFRQDLTISLVGLESQRSTSFYFTQVLRFKVFNTSPGLFSHFFFNLKLNLDLAHKPQILRTFMLGKY